MRKYIYGGDTETLHGEPMTFQFFRPPHINVLLWVDPSKATRQFLEWAGSLRSDSTHVVYIHNLSFDLVSLFWDRREALVAATDGGFSFKVDGWVIDGVYGTPTFARARDGKRVVMLVDSFSYYRASLEQAATLFCPDLPKLTRPDGLGEKRFTAADDAFTCYAMRDAEVAYYIGAALERMHDEFDLVQTVSVADMAARIFRHRFLQRTIPQPDRSVLLASIAAYHGGKNNVAAPPGWHLGVSSLDISSAYPHAMASFPSFSNERAYRAFSGRKDRRVPELGVYRISGEQNGCRWPSLFAHDFTALEGTVDGVFVSGFELNEALKSGEFSPRSITGWYYDVELDRHDSPFKSFVDEFYARKEKETDRATRYMYKTILNSLSGKFIQTRKRSKIPYFDIETGKLSESSELVAGGMFHPFIACAITAHTRARVHRLEHQYQAIHTATDGIFTQAPVTSEPKALGAVVTEARGDLLMLRNKLYILYSDDGETPSTVFDGKRIAKYALHGFMGRLADLERLVVANRRAYKATRVNRLRESVKRGLTPNRFVSRDYTLKVGPLPVYDGRFCNYLQGRTL